MFKIEVTFFFFCNIIFHHFCDILFVLCSSQPAFKNRGLRKEMGRSLGAILEAAYLPKRGISKI